MPECARPPLTHLCIARHGQTDWNAQGILQGWCDVRLNSLGQAQSAALATELAHFSFDAIWSSPLLRARQTAELIAHQWQCQEPVRCHDGLKERHFGVVQGMAKTALHYTAPQLLAQIQQRDPAVCFPDGEGTTLFARRVLAALRDIAGQHPAEQVLVVAHGWVMDVITRHVRGLSQHAVLDHKRGNGEYVWLEVAGARIAAAAPQSCKTASRAVGPARTQSAR